MKNPWPPERQQAYEKLRDMLANRAGSESRYRIPAWRNELVGSQRRSLGKSVSAEAGAARASAAGRELGPGLANSFSARQCGRGSRREMTACDAQGRAVRRGSAGPFSFPTCLAPGRLQWRIDARLGEYFALMRVCGRPRPRTRTSGLRTRLIRKIGDGVQDRAGPRILRSLSRREVNWKSAAQAKRRSGSSCPSAPAGSPGQSASPAAPCRPEAPPAPGHDTTRPFPTNRAWG